MKNKTYLRLFILAALLSTVALVFKQKKSDSIQQIVSTTHKHLQNVKKTWEDAETKTLITDEKYLNLLGFSDDRFYPNDTWKNTSLPVIVTYVMEDQESQAVGFISNVAKVLPNNTILVYDLGLGIYGLKTLSYYCNSSRCQIMHLSLAEFPAHVNEVSTHAYRPLVIQDALQRTGAIFFLENNYRFTRNLTRDYLLDLYDRCVKSPGILTWPMTTKNPVSSLTHKKMFQYFHTDAENYLFLQMVHGDALLLINRKFVRFEVMMPWIKCALTQDCIVPIGAQSAGCRFDKKPQYRYSGCHSYDTSALNIILGLVFNMDGSRYIYDGDDKLFDTIELSRAIALLKEYEQNITTEGRFLSFDNNL